MVGLLPRVAVAVATDVVLQIWGRGFGSHSNNTVEDGYGRGSVVVGRSSTVVVVRSLLLVVLTLLWLLVAATSS